MPFSREEEWLLRDKYAGETTPAFKRDLTRLRKGEPLAYVIGWVDFLGARIGLRHKPLIPRPETEYWTELAAKEIGNRDVAVLDLFCGSGCVGIAVLRLCPRAKVVFADTDFRALRQTRANLKLNGISASRYEIVRSDVWRNVRREFDFVLANPPYVPVSRRARLSASVVRHEPHKALFSGRKGDSLIREFLKGLARHLRPSGKAYLEFDSGPQFRSCIKSHPELSAEPKKDQFGRVRYAEMSARD